VKLLVKSVLLTEKKFAAAVEITGKKIWYFLLRLKKIFSFRTTSLFAQQIASKN